MNGRCSRARGGGHKVIQPVGGCGQGYVGPAKPEVEASDTVITGIIPFYFRSTFVLFYPGSTFSYMYAYFSLGFIQLVRLLPCLFVYLPM